MLHSSHPFGKAPPLVFRLCVNPSAGR